MEKHLIQGHEQIKEIVDRFYAKVREDELIGPIFNDVAKVNWETHTEKIYHFWDALLFGAENYHGRPFPPHIPLNLKIEHFERWIKLFFETVDASFEGQKADEIKMRALNIARNFLNNIEIINQKKSE
jgi:hemoglobin